MSSSTNAAILFPAWATRALASLAGSDAPAPPSLCLRPLDKTYCRLYIVSMKTLTITTAKKNLGQWLAAAARGEDIGIVSGADIIALRKVEVETTDYAFSEYGATPDGAAAF